MPAGAVGDAPGSSAKSPQASSARTAHAKARSETNDVRSTLPLINAKSETRRLYTAGLSWIPVSRPQAV